jgi:HEPN domain-containing protein
LPRKTDSNNPADWLFIAASDLEGLRELATKELAYSMCRGKLAEILEKVLKAELIRRGWFLERTHDLERLRKELRTRDQALADSIQPLCVSLAEVYFTGRYPGFDLEDPNWPDLRAKLEKVAKLLATVQARVTNSPKTA